MAGAAPTVADVDAQLVNAVNLLEGIRKGASVNSDNWLDLKDTMTQALHGEHAGAALRGTEQLEGSLAALLGQPRLLLDPIMLAYGRAIGKPRRSPEQLAREIIPRYFHANSKRVKHRNVGYPSSPGVTMGTNTGTGVIRALNVTADGHTIEHVYAETLSFEVIRDATTPGGARNREVFAVEGETAWGNELQRTGSGIDATLTCVDARRGGASAIIQNGGFDSITETGGFVSDIPGWTVDGGVAGDGSDFSKRETGYTYQPALIEGEPRRALGIIGAQTMRQRLDSKRFPRGVPLGGQIMYNAEHFTATGDLTITIGSGFTATVTFTGQTGDQLLVLPLDATAYPRNFYDDPLEVVIDRTGANELVVDDFIVAPFTEIGGHLLQAIGGSTPFKERDSATRAVTASDAIVQRWIWRAYNTSWPHAASATTGLGA